MKTEKLGGNVMDFSVLMSIYKNEKVDNFKQAMDSILNQTVKPSEIILIRDGAVSDELQTCINGYIERKEITTYIPLENNGGLGNALRIGVEKAKYDLIARMDTDDISVPNRFELQLKLFAENPDLDIVGGAIEEFVDDVEKTVSTRVAPESQDEIIKFMKSRSALNHVTVMFKKDAVLKVGNYIELHYVEDYYLWCRMVLSGCRFLNVPDTLVHVRIGKDMYSRRGGYKYYKSLKELEVFKRRNKMIGFIQYRKNLFIRFAQCVLVPSWMKGFFYKRFARKISK